MMDFEPLPNEFIRYEKPGFGRNNRILDQVLEKVRGDTRPLSLKLS
jgi:hypothetical protein